MRTSFIFVFTLLSLSVYGQFEAPKELFPLFSGMTNLVVDFDQDGDVDLLEIDENLSVYLNNGSGEMEKLVLTHSWDLSSVFSMITSDVNNDSYPDIICWSNTTAIAYMNQGGLSVGDPLIVFTAPSDINIANNFNMDNIVILNMDNDPSLELVLRIVPFSETLYVCHFPLDEPVIVTPIIMPDATLIVDYDYDGDGDILSGSAPNYLVNYNDGNLNFSTTQPIPFTGTAQNSGYVNATDLNNDNQTDFYGYENGFPSVILNSGNGSFEAPVIFDDLPLNIAPYHFVDMTNDGFKDMLAILFFPDTHVELYLYTNNGDGTFGEADTLSLFSSYGPITEFKTLRLVDFDGDGIKDLLFGWKVFKGTGNGAFNEEMTATTAPRTSTLYLTDINSDNQEDIVFQTLDGLFGLLRTGGTYADSALTIAPPGGYAFLHGADLNSDGRNDLLYLAGIGSGIHQATALINDGNSGFHTLTLFPSYYEDVTQMYTRFMDDDSLPDIIIHYIGGRIDFHRNLGNFTFASAEMIGSGHSTTTLISDADEDGDQDKISFIYGPYGESSIKIFENTGNVTFGPMHTIITFTSGNFYNTYDHKDINGDGHLDLFYAYWGDLRIQHGDGLGGYGPPTSLPYEFGSSPSLRDVNHDGLLDICSHWPSLCIRLQDVNGSFLPPYFPPQLIEVTGGTFNTPDNDLIVLADGLYQCKNAFNDIFRGELFVDLDGNNLSTSADAAIPYKTTYLSPSNMQASTNEYGRFALPDLTPQVINTVYPPTIPHFSISTDSLQYSFVPGTNDSIYSHSFGFSPDGSEDSLAVELIGGFPRCNQQVRYTINILNAGSSMPSGIIDLLLDTSIIVIAAVPPADSVSNGHVYWSYEDLAFFSNQQIAVTVQLPSFLSMGDTLLSTVYTTVYENGVGVAAFSDTLEQVLLCAYDPNDKTVEPQGIGPMGWISPDQEWLEYTIRFQNTGNDTAISIIITDQLDMDLDLLSLEILANSHPLTVTQDQYGMAYFAFQNIMLPDSNINYIGSQGFVRYRIRIKEASVPGTHINNTAKIYFDSNPPIITNTVTNTLYDCLPPDYSLPTAVYCYGDEVNATVVSNQALEGSSSFHLNDFEIQSGDTFVWISDTSGAFSLTFTFENVYCSLDTTVLLTILPKNLTVTDTIAICEGEQVSIYGLPRDSPGVYYTTLSSYNGCDSIVGIRLNVFPNPVITAGLITQDTICETSGTITLPVLDPAGSFYSGNGVTGNDFNPNVSGVGEHTVYFSFTDSNSCFSIDSLSITVESCLGIADNHDEELTLFPNPFTGLVTVIHENVHQDYTLTVTSLTGEIIYQAHDLHGSISYLELGYLARGTYLLNLIQPINGHVSTQLLIKE